MAEAEFWHEFYGANTTFEGLYTKNCRLIQTDGFQQLAHLMKLAL